MSLLLLFHPKSSSPAVVIETANIYYLDGIKIRSPNRLTETNTKQYAQNRVLEGDNNRDYFGQVKKMWILEYENINYSDYSIIKTFYEQYLSTGQLKSFEITGDNYSVEVTNVHLDLPQRSFNSVGNNYFSDFILTLTEN